jgi:hypothetical protein
MRPLLKSYKVEHPGLKNDTTSLRYKHEQLLSTTRELVLPAHYRRLLELARFLDISLNFIKQCRTSNGSSSKCLTFEELKSSVEKTYGK